MCPFTSTFYNWSILTNISQLKFAFDPLCLLNPDKVVRVEKPKPGEVSEW